MKNIHVLPTENSSRLSYNKDGVLELHRLQWRKNTQNIYITSNEEIKEGEWFYSPKLANAQGLVDRRDWKKIILTTDQALIKDGVWGIEDGFLEWFVKNPTCEYVELKGYAIVLPGESCDCDNMCDACKEEVVDGLTMGQIPANEETREYDLLQHIKFCLECKNESQAIRLIEKYGFVKQEEGYSEQDMKIAFEANIKDWISFEEFIEQFKNK